MEELHSQAPHSSNHFTTGLPSSAASNISTDSYAQLDSPWTHPPFFSDDIVNDDIIGAPTMEELLEEREMVALQRLKDMVRQHIREPLRTQRVAFCAIPGEIRNTVYEALLEPELSTKDHDVFPFWSNAVGCTKVLVLCRWIYGEAVHILNGIYYVPKVYLFGEGCKVFRHPLANGKPGLFDTRYSWFGARISDGISELEFIRLRTANIHLEHNGSEGSQCEMKSLTCAVSKSSQLQQLHVLIQASAGPRGGSRGDVQLAKKHFLPLIDICIKKGIILTAEANKQFEFRTLGKANGRRDQYMANYWNPLVRLIEKHGGLQASNKSLVKEADEHDEEDSEDYAGKGTTATVLDSNTEPTGKASIERRIASIEKRMKYIGTQGNHEYQLTPECRKCYQVFASSDHLQKHLSQNPKHRISFTKKRYNSIHAFAHGGGEEPTCVVCARSFIDMEPYERHLEKARHAWRDPYAMGIVPRFVCDNR